MLSVYVDGQRIATAEDCGELFKAAMQVAELRQDEDVAYVEIEIRDGDDVDFRLGGPGYPWLYGVLRSWGGNRTNVQ